jgi:predicted outer membrane repeat protein
MRNRIQQFSRFVLIAVASQWAIGETLYVDDDDAGDPSPGDCSINDHIETGDFFFPFDSIEQAVAAASAGDTIVVRPGTYSGSCNLGFTIDKDLLIRRSFSGSGDAILDGEGVRRAFSIDPLVHVQVENLVFRNGRGAGGGSTSGGAIYSNTGDLTATNCVFEDNSCDGSGGAVYLLSSRSMFTDCTFRRCDADVDGGAVALVGGSITIVGGSMTRGTAQRGGGLYALGRVDIDNFFCFGNAADQGGSLFFAANGATVTITNSEIGNGAQSNTATNGGGGIYLTGRTATFSDCEFVNNTSATSGGAVYMDNGTDLTVEDTFWSSNIAEVNAGAIYNEASTLLVKTVSGVSRFTLCSAGERGGAIYSGTNALSTLTDTLISSCASGFGGGAIHTNNAQTNLNSCVLRDNDTPQRGGALRYRNQSSGAIIACSFIDNSAGNDGGAIALTDNSTAITINTSSFTGNTATDDGGALYVNQGATVSSTNDSFTENISSEGRGGAVFLKDVPALVLIDNGTFDGNTAASTTGSNGSGGALASLSTNLHILGGSYENNTAGVAGGGVLSDSGNVLIEDASFRYNETIGLGGAIFSRANTQITIGSSYFSFNTTTGSSSRGGAVCVEQGPLTIERETVFYANEAINGEGGAIYTIDSDVIVQDCNIINNQAVLGAGSLHTGDGIYSAHYRDTAFTRNRATAGGGAVALDLDGTFHSCGFYGNSAVDSGGAIDSFAPFMPRSLDVAGCEFSCNTVEFSGGAIRASNMGNLSVVNATFHANEATDPASGSGGAVWIGNGTTAMIGNSIFSDNTDVSGNTFPAQIFLDSGTVAVGTSCFTDPACPPANELRPPYGTGPGTNICANPMFVDPDGPDDLCGTDDDDLRLLPSSACIDAGCNDIVPRDILDLDADTDLLELLPLDIRGNDRFIDAPCAANYTAGCAHPDFPGLPVVDLGAHELAECPIDCPADFNNDGVLDFFDVAAFLAAFSAQDPAADLTGDGIFDFFDVAAYLAAFSAGCP